MTLELPLPARSFYTQECPAVWINQDLTPKDLCNGVREWKVPIVIYIFNQYKVKTNNCWLCYPVLICWECFMIGFSSSICARSGGLLAFAFPPWGGEYQHPASHSYPCSIQIQILCPGPFVFSSLDIFQLPLCFSPSSVSLCRDHLGLEVRPTIIFKIK